MRRAAASAREAGALRPLATRLEHVSDAGFRFAVRVLEGPDPKRAAGKEQRRSGIDPFLPPYEPGLFVGTLTETHVCLLNKYKVVDSHALVVTRAYEPQEQPLNEGDFQALGPFMEDCNALAFYNSAPAAGASQPHKHLQVLPFPAADRQGTLLAALSAGTGGSAGFRYAWAKIRGGDTWRRPSLLAELYSRLLAECCEAPTPYNLLATSDAMVIVPRSRGDAFGVPVNALGFAGSLFAQSPDQLDRVRETGPLALLRAVALPP